jgi:hypothetical protein
MSKRRPQTESELIEFLHAIDEPAPQELHSKIDALVAERAQSPRRSRWPSAFAAPSSRGFKLGAATAVLAVLAVVLVASLSGGGSTLTVRQASALTLRAPTMAAPMPSASNSRQLDAAVDGVPFPYWEDRFGWRSTGARVDHVAGRTITTVFYSNGRGQRIGYAIVAGTPAPTTSGGAIVWHHAVPYRVTRANGTTVVTWTRDGHLCVVAGRGMSSATLLRLASWNDGAVSA